MNQSGAVLPFAPNTSLVTPSWLRSLQIEKVALAPVIPPAIAGEIRQRGWLVEDLPTLTVGLE